MPTEVGTPSDYAAAEQGAHMHQEAVPNAQNIAGKDKGKSFCLAGTCF